MKNSFAGTGIVLGIFLSSSFLLAQPCLTAKPAPACRSCFITELGYGYKINPPLKRTSINMAGDSVTNVYEWEVTGRHYLTSELGYIYNLNAKYGLGFTHFTGWDVGHNLRGGLKLRMRRWLNQKTSLDLSSGALLWNSESELKHPAFIGGASLNFSDWEALNVLIEVLETQSYEYSYPSGTGGMLERTISPRRRNVSVYLGYKLSSKPGLLLNGIALVTVGALFVLFLTTYPAD